MTGEGGLGGQGWKGGGGGGVRRGIPTDRLQSAPGCRAARPVAN